MSHKRVLTFILALAILLGCTGFTPAYTTQSEIMVSQTPEQETQSTLEKKPPAADPDGPLREQHVERLHKEEQLNTHVFRNKDGTKTMYIYDHPVKYIDERGQAQDISLDIADTGNGSHPFRTKANSAVTEFPAALPDGVTLRGNGVSIRMTGRGHSGRRMDTQTIAYTYDEKTTIEYSLTYTGFKEDIVVSEYTGQTEYPFTLYTNGLDVTNLDDNYYLTDDDGNIQAAIGEIIVFTADERNNTLGTLRVTEVEPGQQYELTIVLDADYLADSNTVYPIRIDPTVELVYTDENPNAIEEKTLQSNNTTSGSNTATVIGKNSKGISRTIMKFPGINFSAMNDVTVISAVVTLRDLMCESEEMTITCYPFTGGAWTEDNTQWAGLTQSWGAALDSNVVSYATGVQQEVSHRYRFDITTLAQQWVNGTADESLGIIFRSPDAVENDTEYFYKTFATSERASYKPTFEITYVSHGNGGNTFDDAVSLSTETTIDVAIAVSNEKRYFMFTPNVTGFYTFESSNNEGDPCAFLYNSNREQLLENNDAVSLNFRLTYHLVSGRTYYLAVGCHGQTTGTYQISLSKSLPVNLTATIVVADGSYSFTSTKASEAKCYSFIPTETCEYVIHSANSTAISEIHLYNANLDKVCSSNNDIDGDFYVKTTLTSGQKYYIVVCHAFSNVGSYFFSILRPATIDNRFYQIKNQGTEQYLDIHGPNEQELVHQWTASTGEQQKWLIQKHADGYYTIRSQYDKNLFVGVTNTNVGENNIQLFDAINDQTRWNVYVTSNGTYVFEPKIALGRALRAPDSETGTEMQLGWMITNISSDNWNLLVYDYHALTFSAFDVSNSSQDEVAIVSNWLARFGYKNIGAYDNSEDYVGAQTIKDVGRYSDIIYINGHGEKYSNLQIRDADASVIEYLCADLSCTSSYYYDVPRVVIGAEWLPGSTTKTTSYWNVKTKWVILAQCDQLNYGADVGAGNHWNNGTMNSAQMWARTMLGDGERIHGYVGYYNLAANGEDHAERLNDFFSYCFNENKTICVAWRLAHTRVIGSSDWAMIYHSANEADRFGAMMDCTESGADYQIIYLARGNSQTTLPLRSTVSNNSYAGMSFYKDQEKHPMFIDSTLITMTDSSTYSTNAMLTHLQKKLQITDDCLLDISPNGRITYQVGDWRWGDGIQGFELTNEEALAVAEQYLALLDLTPDGEYRATVSKVVRCKLNLEGEQLGTPEPIEYTVTFYRTFNGIDIVSDQEDGILLSFNQSGLTELRYLWREMVYVSNDLSPQSNLLTLEQAVDIYQAELNSTMRRTLSPTSLAADNAYPSVAYLQIDGDVRPVYAFSTDEGYANCIFVDMYTGEVYCC